MGTSPGITDADIRNQVSPESYRRGEPYYRRGAVHDARRSGAMLRALCEGSRAEPYRVTAQLGARGVSYAHCTCPVGAEGRCKHVAAVLLAWLEDPGAFLEVEDLERALARRDVEELRAMLRYVMRRQPELEVVLEMRFPIDGGGDVELEPEVYRGQARAIFREHAQGLGATSQISDSLRPLVELVDGFRARGDWPSAIAITRALVDEITAQLPNIKDDEGFLDALLGELLLNLEEVLREREAPRLARHAALGALAHMALAEAAPRARQRAEALVLDDSLGAEDRQEIALHLRQRMREDEPQGHIDSWLLLQLEAPTLDEQSFSQRCRALGRQDALVRHMLSQERLDDALDEVARVEDEHLLGLVEAFAERGWAEQVEPLVLSRYEGTGDLRLLSWLEARYVERGDDALALSSALARFYREPSHQVFSRIRELSRRAPGQWEVLRPSLLAHLRLHNAWEVLVHAHIHDDDFDEAAEALKSLRRHGHVGQDDWLELAIELADAARRARPHLSTRLYRTASEKLIERRSLANFKRAASFLAHARAIAIELREVEPWRLYMEELLDRYGRFQGLREALQAVGLV